MIQLDKNLTPNIVALLIIASSFMMEDPIRQIVLNVGLFALSGAITNWLAVHMLFERVPGLYGSGVIPLHFEEFKHGILTMVNKQLFKKEVVESAFAGRKNSNTSTIDIEPLMNGLDLDTAYDQLSGVIMESSFGAMLGMMGGAEALEPLRNPFKKRMNSFLVETAKSPKFQQAVNAQISNMASSEDFMKNINSILETRLDQLTPEMVKDIVQEMIRKHLGWLVVWGGVFGGVIGLITALVF